MLPLLKTIRNTVLTIVVILFISGCSAYELQRFDNDINTVNSQVADIAKAVGDVRYSNDETLNFLKALEAGNAASAPLNPYALPIGAGLTGIIALLEGLRRKEQSSRKYAQHELRNGKNGTEH